MNKVILEMIMACGKIAERVLENEHGGKRFELNLEPNDPIRDMMKKGEGFVRMNKLIQEILSSEKSSTATKDFVGGISSFLEANGHLSEKQRLNLESTHKNLFNGVM